MTQLIPEVWDTRTSVTGSWNLGYKNRSNIEELVLGIRDTRTSMAGSWNQGYVNQTMDEITSFQNLR